MHREGVYFTLALGQSHASVFLVSKTLLHAVHASALAVVLGIISGGLKAASLEPIVAHCLNGSCPVWQGDDAADEIVVRQLFAAQIDSLGEGQLPRLFCRGSGRRIRCSKVPAHSNSQQMRERVCCSQT